MKRKIIFLIFIAIPCLMHRSSIANEIEPQPIPPNVRDNGLNICIDSAHQFLFFWHWTVQDKMRAAGFRVTGNMQVLNKTLQPGALSLMRDQRAHDFNAGLHRPFVLLPNPEFHAVITYQFGPYQEYTPEEVQAVIEFVQQGGGLLMFGQMQKSGGDRYPLQELARRFDANFSTQKGRGPWKIISHPAVNDLPQIDAQVEMHSAVLGKEWTPLVLSHQGDVVLAVRSFGKGRVLLSADAYLHLRGQNPDDADLRFIFSATKWTAAAKKPFKDDRRVPWEYGGLGGAIYPCNQEKIGGITVLYADNQQPKVMQTIRERTREVYDLLQRMLPSPPPQEDELYIIPSAGAGGGWAVNVYTPRSAAICCNDENTDELLSIMAHEIAHTMTGPPASDGSTNGRLPEQGVGLFSEAHAGWFQKKVTQELGIHSPSHDLSDLTIIDPTLRELDLTYIPEGKVFWAWKKLWFLYTILERQFGEKFYADWMYQVHEYAKNRSPGYELNWQETLITLSRAVNADVFPFFAAFGTKVQPPLDWEMPPMRSLVREAYHSGK